MAESLLFTTARVTTFDGPRLLTGATGFFFTRSERLFLVTSRYVLQDIPSGHRPNRIELEFHTDPVDLRRTATLSIWLFKNGISLWRQATDSGGEIDVGVIELDKAELSSDAHICCFTTEHLQSELGEVEVGTGLLVVGFPLGFHDTMHHLPVVR